MEKSNSTINVPDVTNVVKAKELIHQVFETAEERRNKGVELSINFLPSIGKKIKGLSKGELVIIGARPSNGKSAFALSMALDFAKQGRKVHFFSLEMTKISCMERILANVCGIDSMSFVDGSCFDNPDINEKQNKAYNLMQDMEFTFSDSIGKTFQDIQFICEKMKGIDVVIIDYIQMIKGVNGKMKDSIDEYIKNLRNIAIKKDICVVLCSQVNRAGANVGIPQLHELKSTGCLHPDTVVDGSGKTIKEIYDKQEFVDIYTYDKDKKEVRKTKPYKILNTGMKDCIKIKTKSGKEIIMSKDTELFNGEEWIYAGEYVAGDKIIVASSRGR